MQPEPVCGVTEYVTPGAIVENTTGLFQAYVGTDSATWGQKGALAAAWFEGGAVKEVRFDSMAVLTATSTTNDASSGEWRTRDTYVYSSATGQCERTETYNVDSRIIDFHARRVEDTTYTLRLYAPDGGEQVTTLRRFSTMDGRFFPSDPAQTIDAQTSTVYQGGEEFETTSSSSPGILGGALHWGYQLTNDTPCYSLVNGYWQMSTLDHSVLFCSNKLVTLGQLERSTKPQSAARIRSSTDSWCHLPASSLRASRSLFPILHLGLACTKTWPGGPSMSSRRPRPPGTPSPTKSAATAWTWPASAGFRPKTPMKERQHGNH